MKTKMSYKMKKNIVISIIIAILMLATGIGIYLYSQGNNDAEAKSSHESLERVGMNGQENNGNQVEENINVQMTREEENESEEISENKEEKEQEQSINEDEEQQEEIVEQEDNNESEFEQEEAGAGAGAEENEESEENVNENETSSSDETMEDADEQIDESEQNQDEEIEYTTVERIEEEEVLVSETFDLIWEPMSIDCNPVIANIDITYPEEEPEIEEEPEVEEKEPAIEIEKRRLGEGKAEVDSVITYEIEVKNTGETSLEDVKVYDIMSVDKNNEERKVTVQKVVVENEERKWEEEAGVYNIGKLEVGQSAIITATYIVKESDVDETEQTITNTAKATALSEGKTPIETDESKVDVQTIIYKADIELKKESKLEKVNPNSLVGSDVAEYGDKIIYTITATNKGNKDGKVIVKDCIPTGVKLVKYDADTTNLSEEEYAELRKATKENEFSKELKVKANNGKTSIFFTVEVIGLPGTTVQNIATDARDESDVPEPGNKIEKVVTVKKSEESFKNTNLVVILDRSRTMQENKLSYNGKKQTRIDVAKQVINTYIIDKMDFKDDGTGSAVSVVEFWGPYSNSIDSTENHYRWNNVVGTANTDAQATILKTGVNNIKVNSNSNDQQTGTVISSSLIRAKEQMVALYNLNPNNNNVVIFISDGKPEGDDDENNIETYANNLKSAVPGGVQVFTIGFGANPDDDKSWKKYLQETIATSSNHFFHAASSNMDQVFNDLSKVVALAYVGNSVSNNGIITLTDVKISEPIIIKVTNAENVTKTITENATSETHTIDLSRFDADAKIEIEYHKKN